MPQNPAIMTSSQLLEWWLSHRQLTRRVIEAFPEEDYFAFSIGGMRTAADVVSELLQMGGGMVHGVATGEWSEFQTGNLLPDKAAVLAAWDEDLELIRRTVPQLTDEQFRADHNAFGFFSTTGLNQLLYSIENEIHHRGQLYVYLRALGIEPPKFYERSLSV